MTADHAPRSRRSSISPPAGEDRSTIPTDPRVHQESLIVPHLLAPSTAVRRMKDFGLRSMGARSVNRNAGTAWIGVTDLDRQVPVWTSARPGPAGYFCHGYSTGTHQLDYSPFGDGMPTILADEFQKISLGNPTTLAAEGGPVDAISCIEAPAPGDVLVWWGAPPNLQRQRALGGATRHLVVSHSAVLAAPANIQSAHGQVTHLDLTNTLVHSKNGSLPLALNAPFSAVDASYRHTRPLELYRRV